MIRRITGYLSSHRDMVIRRAAMAGVILSATVLSYSVLRDRAVHIGLPVWSSWFYPLIFDAFILAASRTWTNPDMSRSTRILAMVSTIAAIVAAISAFIAEFWGRGIVAVLFACAIPAVLALALVITSRAAADRVALNTTPVPETSGMTLTSPGVMSNAEPITITAFSEMPEILHVTEPATTEERRAWIRNQLDNGVDLSAADINKHFGKPDNGYRLLNQVKKERV